MALTVATGNLALPGRAAATWTMGDPIVSHWIADTLTETMAQHAVAGGFNIVWINRSQVVGQAQMLAQLDIAQTYGLRGVVHSYILTPEVLDAPTWRTELLDPLIDAFKTHPAAYGYFIADEPSATRFADLARLKDYILQRDPDHLVHINLADNTFATNSLGVPTHQEYLDQYLNTVQPQLISYDHYTFVTGGDRYSYFSNLATFRRAAIQVDVPLLNVVQGMGWEDPNSSISSYRLPNANELRFLNYTTLAYGGQGISYFNYWRFEGATGGIQPYPDGSDTEVYTALKSLNPQFMAIAGQLQPLASLGAYHLGDRPPGTVRLPGNSPFTVTPPLPDTVYVTNEPVEGMLIGLFGPRESAATTTPPTSDGSLFFEDFSAAGGTAGIDPKSVPQGVSPEVVIAGGQLNLVTTTIGQAGWRAGDTGALSLGPFPADAEYVVEFDLQVNAETGDHWDVLRPFRLAGGFAETGIQLQAEPGAPTGFWGFNVLHADGITVADLDLPMGQMHHFAVHRKVNTANEINIWVNGTLLGAFVDRRPAFVTDAVQWGDPSAAFAFGDVTLDNLSIGLDTRSSTFALVVNLDYDNGTTTTVNGPGPLSIFDATAGTWSATGESSALLDLEPGGGVLVGLSAEIPAPSTVTMLSCGVCGLLAHTWRNRRCRHQ